MKIGILGAMIEEVSAIKEMMIVEKETIIANRTYYEGYINEVPVVLCFSRWGKVASATTTTTLINTFGVELVIFTGVAGARDKSLNVGDIVIGSGTYQHDMDARPFFDKHQIPLTNNIIFSPRDVELETARLAATNFVDKIHTSFDTSILSKFSIFKPSVHCGLIATGDQFISDAEHPNLTLSTDTANTLAVEMEGAAVAQVCHEHEINYVIIRTISDKADHTAVIDFPAFVSEVASKYSSGIVQEYISLSK